MHKTLIKASILNDFIKLLYVFALGYKELELPLVRDELKSINWEAWESLLPSIDLYVKDMNRGSADNRTLLSAELKAILPSLQTNQKYTSDELKIIKAIKSWLANDKETTWKVIVRRAPIFSPFASSILYDDSFDQDVVGEMMGLLDEYNILYDNILIPKVEQTKFKQSYPEAYDDYVALRSEFLRGVKNIVTSYINSHGGKIPYQQLYKFLVRQNLEYAMPSGFTGYIDTAGSWYSPDGQLLECALPVTTYPKVEMNDSYDPIENQWVCRALPNTGNDKVRYIYTVEQVKQNQKLKFTKVKKLLENMTKYRNKWLKLIKSFNPSKKECISAVVLELLYQTAGRVGSFSNSNGTFGINTLQLRHISLLDDGSISFHYPGKDNVSTRYKIKLNAEPINKILIPILKDLVADKVDKKAPIFTTDDGKRVTPRDTNLLFKKIVGDPNVNVHKIRTFRGTLLFIEQVEKAKIPSSQTEAARIYKVISEKVGKALNHVRRTKDGKQKAVGTTAQQNYIDPSVQIKFFAENGFRVPPKLERYLDSE